MTHKDHQLLYNHLHEAINKRLGQDELSGLQQLFVEAFEAGCFGIDFLKYYAATVDAKPAITLVELHCVCIGHGIGYKQYNPNDEKELTSH